MKQVETKQEEIIEHILGEFGVTVMYSLHPDFRAHVDFVAVEIATPELTEAGVMLGRAYERKGARSSGDFVVDPHEAEIYVQGAVKWDGCVNYQVGNHDVMMHACGREDLQKLHATLIGIFERCGELMKARGTDLLENEFACAEAERTK